MLTLIVNSLVNLCLPFPTMISLLVSAPPPPKKIEKENKDSSYFFGLTFKENKSFGRLKNMRIFS